MIGERKLNFDAVNNIQMLNFNLSNLLSTDLHMEMLCSINLPSLSHGVPISSNSSREENNLEEEIEAMLSHNSLQTPGSKSIVSHLQHM